RARKPGSEKRSATSASSSRWPCMAWRGTAMASTRSTGSPSAAPKSTGGESRRKAPRLCSSPSTRACGIATPWPIAVLARRSRASSPSPMAVAALPSASASIRAAVRITAERSPGASTIATRPASSRPCNAMSSAEPAAPGQAPGPAGLVVLLLLGPDQGTLELVGQQVDRRVHVVGGSVHVQGAAVPRDRGLGAVAGLVQLELHADVVGLLEVALHAPEARLDVVTEGGGDLDVVEVDFDAHGQYLHSSLRGVQHIPAAAGRHDPVRPCARGPARRRFPWPRGTWRRSCGPPGPRPP